MKAVGYSQSLPISDEASLLDIELPMPVYGEHDLLVKVAAVSVNPVDTKIRLRTAPSEGFNVLGYDAVGLVEEVGDAVTNFSVGDRIWYAGSMVRAGSNAEYQAVDARLVAKAPVTLGDAEAAALPLTALTAWELLFDRLQLDADSTGHLLVIGGAGGVGSVLIQLAKRLTGMTIVATASRPESRHWLQQLGADWVINHNSDMASQCSALGIEKVEAIASLNGTAEHLPFIAELIAPQGHFALIDDAPVLDIMPFKRKSVSVHWEFMFTRSLFQTSDMAVQGEYLALIAEMVDRHLISTTMTESYGAINAENLRRAHALLESGKARGKIVLQGFDWP